MIHFWHVVHGLLLVLSCSIACFAVGEVAARLLLGDWERDVPKAMIHGMVCVLLGAFVLGVLYWLGAALWPWPGSFP